MVLILARFWRLEGCERGPRTNTRWMTSPHWLFENLDRSRKFSTSTVSTWLAGRILMLQGRRELRQETNWQRFPKDHYERKGRLNKEFHTFLYKG
jgi:hypothetical protein